MQLSLQYIAENLDKLHVIVLANDLELEEVVFQRDKGRTGKNTMGEGREKGVVIYRGNRESLQTEFFLQELCVMTNEAI